MADPLVAAGTAFFVMVAAEFGDKTQLLLLALAAKHDGKRVLLGAVAAFGLLTAVAVAVGDVLGGLVPTSVVTVAAAALFIAAGVWMLVRALGDGEEEEDEEARFTGHGAFFMAFGSIALLELGDKTQLAVLGLASAYQAPVMVFLGAWLGLAVISLLGVLAGGWIGRHVADRTVTLVGAVAFILVGALLLLL